MVVLVGESGCGKTTVREMLLEKGFEKIVTYTSRKPRVGEVNHRDYHFIPREDFIQRIFSSFFTEYSVYRGNYYGSNDADYKRKGVIILEPKGIAQLLENDMDIIIVYVKVNEKERTKRLIDRGDDLEVICEMIKSDKETFKDIESIAQIVFDNNGELTEEKIIDLSERILRLL